jgi:hypothetical protein
MSGELTMLSAPALAERSAASAPQGLPRGAGSLAASLPQGAAPHPPYPRSLRRSQHAPTLILVHGGRSSLHAANRQKGQ